MYLNPNLKLLFEIWSTDPNLIWYRFDEIKLYLFDIFAQDLHVRFTVYDEQWQCSTQEPLNVIDGLGVLHSDKD